MATPHKAYPNDAVKKLRALGHTTRKNGIPDPVLIEAIRAFRRGGRVHEIALALGIKRGSIGNLYAHVGSWAIRAAVIPGEEND